MADRVGQQLGNYKLVRLLGRGAFAQVYLGEHLHLGTQAAIKVLSATLQRDEINHFREEARTIARLRHPAIVRVLEFGVEGDVPYLVMDYAVNGTLRQRHPRGTMLTPAALVPYVRQVASALQFAHDHKLIHRDVKPENMLVAENGEVLLSDFGIATVAHSSRSQSVQDSAGTLPYMAPEQIQGRPRPASDQYSLGIVIYEWLAGERPFSGSLSEILAKQISVPPSPLREKLPNLSSTLEQVVLTALEKDHKARFASIQAFASAFEQAALLNQQTQTIGPSTLLLHPAPAVQAPTIVGPPVMPQPPAQPAPPSTALQSYQAQPSGSARLPPGPQAAPSGVQLWSSGPQSAAQAAPTGRSSVLPSIPGTVSPGRRRRSPLLRSMLIILGIAILLGIVGGAAFAAGVFSPPPTPTPTCTPRLRVRGGCESTPPADGSIFLRIAMIRDAEIRLPGLEG